MPADHQALVELLEAFLLGSEPTLTGDELAERTGIDRELSRARWRSLGFPNPADDEVAFTEADLEASLLTQRLHELGVIDEADEAALIRTMGRSFARLAEWQMDLLGRTIDIERTSEEELTEVMLEITPLIESIMSYVWRRHMVAVGTRKLLALDAGQSPAADEPDGTDQVIAPADEGEGEGDEAGHDDAGHDAGDDAVHDAGDDVGDEEIVAVGFADIVNYTKTSQRLTRKELETLIEDFEAATQTIVAAHAGRIIKTIGDEVMFVADSPAAAARIALELTECHLADEAFPELRVGLAYGPVLSRLGDVFGSVVNLASRLTSTARPGRVVGDSALAEALAEDEDFRLRKLRRTSVKGMRRIEPWAIKRPADQNPHLDPENQPGPASARVAEHAKGILRAVSERDRPAPAEEPPE